MNIWVDAQISPLIARWMSVTFGVVAVPVRDLGLRDACDLDIFQAAKSASVTVMTKDDDFLRLLARYGPPPQVIWVTCGNTSNSRLRGILTVTFPKVFLMLQSGEPLVQISDPFSSN